MKRYDPELEYDFEVVRVIMEQDDTGDWVCYEDAKAVVEALEDMLMTFEAKCGAEFDATDKASAALEQINGE